MAGEPGAGRNDDLRLAESLRAGDVIALTEVYDTYAPFLYDYCHGLLRDRVEATGALRNVIIAAREHVERLTEPDRLRGWLYAIARKECMRRRDSPNRHTGQEAPEADDDLTPEQLARREERRLLAYSAVAALNGRQREAIDLSARHELDEVDLCGIFGIPLEETLALAERARADLATALRAAIIAQNHWKGCPTVASLAEAWPLSPQTAASLVRHVASCPMCERQETPPLPPDRLLAVLPIAALPTGLRLDVLTAATAEDRAGNRRAIAAWIEPFDEYGWPLPYEPTAPRARDRAPRRRAPLLAATAVGVGLLVLFGGAMSWLNSGNGSNTAATDPRTPEDGGSPEDSRVPEETPTDPSPTVTSPSPTASKTPSKSPSPSPSKSPSETPSTRPPASPTTRAPKPSKPGTLRVTGCSMDKKASCTVEFTAVGGPVNWRVTGTSGPIRAEGAGHLDAGETGGVQVSRSSGFCLGTQSGSVTVSPGGSVTVFYRC